MATRRTMPPSGATGGTIRPAARRKPTTTRAREAPPTLPPSDRSSRSRPAPPPAFRADAGAVLAVEAKKLPEEQLRAKVKYFGPEQETNAELDAITAVVVAELHALQAAGTAAVARKAPPDIERELSRHLKIFLDKLLSRRRKAFLDHKVREIQRRITTMFFNSELFVRLSTTTQREVRVAWADQAVFYALKRHEESIVADIRRMEYVDPSVQDEAIARLDQLERALRMEFLSRTTPELEKLLELFRNVLTQFFRQFRKDLSTFCPEAIRQSGVAATAEFGYKIGPASFAPFRETFERMFLYALVRVLQDPIAQFGREMQTEFRRETIEFMGDPQIFSEISAVLCDACYEYLYGEGFLELPDDWRAHLEQNAQE